MIRRLGWLCIALGIVLRLVAVGAHDVPRGDVVLDIGVARSLAEGEGFAAGYERAVARVAGSAPVLRQDLADQHSPLWPVVGALLSFLAGSPFAGLKLGSLLAGLLTLWLTWRVTDRLTEGLVGAPDGLPALACGLVALSFLAIDSSGNGSLYAAQAALVLGLVELLAAPRTRWLGAGLVLGALLLLNHQCAVLLPLPVLVLFLGAEPGRRGRGLVYGLIIAVVALLCQLPWWIRNAMAFDDPFYSVNGIYLLSRAGVPMDFTVEDGVPVFRFAQELTPLLALKGSVLWLRPNLLYVFSTGLLLWPGLLGIVAAGGAPLAAGAEKARDRRLLGLVGAGLILGLVAVLWPAMKLRYMVVLVPIVVALGVRLAARPAERGERWLLPVVLLGWLGVLLLTVGDVTGALEDARPERWWRVAVGGLVLMAAPAAVHRLRSSTSTAGLLVTTGLVVAPALACLALVEPPRTAYHGTLLVPDFFGGDGEADADRRARVLAAARERALAAGAVTVAGPVELLSWRTPALVELPTRATFEILHETLKVLAERGDVDHAILLHADAVTVGLGTLPEEGALLPGGHWQIVDVGDEEGAVLLAVTP